jgi:hypothetical protein
LAPPGPDIHRNLRVTEGPLGVRELLCAPERVAKLSPAEAATALAELAMLQAALMAQLAPKPSASPADRAKPEGDQLLTAEDVAERLQRSVDWVYRQARHWPFTRRLTRRTLRFSEAGLQRFLAQRRSLTPPAAGVSSGR